MPTYICCNVGLVSMAVGKSSLMLTFALFGKHTRKNNKGLVRRGANTASVQVIFTIDGTRYLASRKIATKGETSATLQKYDGAQWQGVITGERKGLGESMTSNNRGDTRYGL